MSKILKKLKKIAGAIVLAQSLIFFMPISTTQGFAASGFHVNGTKVYDSNGKVFVMRGINHAHAWWKGQEETVIPKIAETGANTIRIALGDGDTWGYDDINTLNRIISLCEDNNLVAVLDVHDTTGLDDYSKLDNAVNYWISMKSA